VPFQDRSGIAFIGCYRHRPNADAAVYIARELMPRLRGSGEPIQAFLVGPSEDTPRVRDLSAADVRVLGVVPDLSHLLHRIRCTVAPLRYGAGIKGKVLESFAHGIPCVMSEVAAEGLNLPTELQWLVACSAEEMAAKVRAIHEDQALNKRLSEESLQYIADGFGPNTIDRLLEAAL
jgi:glycosyltransferase involved in cell wall biosynthesis